MKSKKSFGNRSIGPRSRPRSQPRYTGTKSGTPTYELRSGTHAGGTRQFGDVYLALALWRGTGLEDLCERLLPIGKERIAWAKMAAVLVMARLCEPSSELHIAEDWYRRTALAVLTIETAANRWLSFNIREDRLLGTTVGTRVGIMTAGFEWPGFRNRHRATAARTVRDMAG